MEFTAPSHPQVNSWLNISLQGQANGPITSYSIHPAFDFAPVAAYKAAPAPRPIHETPD
jgi:hypothetical protein